VNSEDPNIEGTQTPSMVADQFIATEIEKSRSGLKQTQIIGSIVFLFIFFYIGSIALKFQSSLQPSEAALIAKGMVAERVNEGGPELTSYLKREIPAVIEKAPEYVMQELPNYRTQLEDRLEQEFQKYTDDTSAQLSAELDQFLAGNQEQFKTVMLTGQDPKATKELTSHLRELFVSYLAEKPEGEESVQEKIDASLQALGKIKAMTARLAAGKNLTPAEQKTRRAIAVLLTTIDQKKAEDPMPSAEQMTDAVKSTYKVGNTE
jgi:hypothetical protein